MNEQQDEYRPGKKVLARTVPEEAEINEAGLELINISEVQNLTQISTSGIYSRSKDSADDFPESVDIGTKGKGSKKMWVRLEVLKFISARMELRRTTVTQTRVLPSYAEKLNAEQRRILDNRRLGRDEAFIPLDKYGDEVFTDE